MYGTLDEQQLRGDCATAATQEQANGQRQLARNDSQSSRSAESGELAGGKRKRKIFSHCHMASEDGDLPGAANETPQVDKSARRRLIVASVICLIFMIGEVVGGVLSGSLAIATDAAHLLTDFASFMISLFAIWLSSRPASRKMSFGWYRAEVIGALLSVLMIWLVTGLLVYMAVERLRTGEFEIDATVMVITASAGLLVNIIMAIALNVDGHSHHGHFHAHGSHGSHNHSHSHDDDIRNHSHLVHMHEDDDDEFNGENDSQNAIEQSDILPTLGAGSKGDLMTKSLIDSKQTNGLLANGQSHDSNNKCKKINKNKKNSKKCNGESQQQQQQQQQQGRGRANINVRAAFIHVIGDFLQSLGVLIAALVIYFEPSYAIVDPICTFLFSIIVLVTTLNIIRDATNVLMEGIPDGINFIEVREKLQTLPGVVRVHNLRIWSLSLDKIAISTHLVIDTTKVGSAQALRKAIETLKSSYNFFEVTIQIEEYRDDMKDCEQCQDEDDVVINVTEANGQPTANVDSTRRPAGDGDISPA